MEDNSAKHTGPTKLVRSLSRGSRLILGGGLAVGAGFGAVTGVSAAATSSSSSGSTSTGPAPRSGLGAPTPNGAPAPNGGPGALGGPGGPGGGGTITAIDGTTLILRTENGAETVDTSSSTTYNKEMKSVTFKALQVGSVVHVASRPPSTGSSTKSGSTPPQPGTGTVDAAEVTIVEPSFAGRVSAVGTGTYTVVGRDGHLFTITTTGSTRYYNGTTQAGASAVSVGSRVMAEGTRDSLTHLTADVVMVGPVPPSPPAGAPTPPSPPAGSGSPVS